MTEGVKESTSREGKVEPQRRQIIVLGMHRSGTSMITGILAGLGAHIGDRHELLSANSQNPKGFFERHDIRRICNRLLQAAGGAWWNIAGFAPDRIPEAALRDAGMRFATTVAHLNAHGTWALKEPRLCLLLPFLRQYLSSPIVVHIYRNPVEVAQSLAHRDGFPIQASLALWEAYNVSAINNAAGLPRVFISYNAVLEDPLSVTNRLRAVLDSLGVTGLRRASADTLLQFVDKRLHRQHANSLRLDDVLTNAQKQLWRALQDSDEQSRVFSAEAKEILEVFEWGEARRLRLVADRDERDDQLSRIAAELAYSEMENARLTGEVSGLAAKVGQRDKAMEQLAKQVADAPRLASRVARLTDDLTRRNAKVALLTSELTKRNAKVKQLTAEIAQRKERAQHSAANLPDEETDQSHPDVDSRRMKEVGGAQVRYSGVQAALEKRELTTEPAIRPLSTPRRWLSHWTRGSRNALGLISVGPKSAPTARLIAKSGLFDRDWYLARYPEIAKAGVDPLAHYVRSGATEGRDPNRFFDTEWYCATYVDVAKSGMNPLEHYVRFGASEGRDPSPRFDTDWYLSRYPDVAESGINPLAHYLRFGASEGRASIAPAQSR